MKSLTAWGIFTLLLTGCLTPLPELTYEQWSERILHRESSSHKAGLVTQPSQQQFTFAEAFELAIAASPELSSSHLPLELARIDLEQAQSVVWPRVSLEGVYEIPLEDDGAERNFDGGLRIDYDLTKALFKRDFITAASLERQKALIEQSAMLQKLRTQLLNNITEQKILESKIVIINDTLNILEQERQAIHSVAQIKGLRVTSEWPLDEKIFAYQRMKRLGTSRLQQIVRSLRQMLGLSIAGSISISDADLLITKLTKQYSQIRPNPDHLGRVLHQQPEVRQAVLEIMASVLTLRKAEMEGLPRIGLSLGYGDFALRQSDEDAGLVGFINLSIPMFDFGDNSRKQEIAQINEQIARRKLRSVSHQAANELHTALGETKSSHDEFEQTRSWYEKSHQRVEEINKLQRDKRIDRKDYVQAIVTNARINLDLLDTKLKWLKGLILLSSKLPDVFHADAEAQ